MSAKPPGKGLGSLGQGEAAFTGPGENARGSSPSRFPLILLGLLKEAVGLVGHPALQKSQGG